ncbi:type VII secretion system-associated protein [Amycolatopsis sp. EV170708-02-1]|uniref:type VII secretion system-associated protein n=1 Tax=Amycolatopsis sp. EV170708-02-1 TaxID=2919322 RepID=UPI001F0CADC5|nr:type VII secretion system-associated protein [Amycolatopsis sp. EV170708-02-1]UMP06973.1 type VII secretion system-associated protein [Amycolatopsis sp. EV170708-02-1]
MTEDPDAAAPVEDQSTPDTVMLLIDPAWEATDEAPEPPVSALLGVWALTEAGDRGRFQSNPVYQPITADSPLDPVDAVLRLLARDDQDQALPASMLESVLRDVTLSIALNEQGAALVRPAPDGVPSVLVTTAAGHSRRLAVPGWRALTVEQLAEALPARGVDVLLNPGAPASMRVLADVIRRAAEGADDSAVDDGDPAS